ncbi:MAG: glycosyltransferase 87 family protein [Candidatus Bathyarchaeia archaeon]
MSEALGVDRKFIGFIAGYSIFIAVLYSIPLGLDGEWYGFYAYLDAHGAVPYVDLREGYPPLGFLVYMPIYYFLGFSRAVFSYGFRALNGGFLVATVATLYLALRQVLDSRRAFWMAFCYALMPSVIVANLYSNDVVALLPASLAIYFMVKGRPLLCGFLIGLATLGKGFPLLLLLPALMAFKGWGERFRVLASAAAVLALGSLPLLLLNPLTYISTYTHHGSRGPWETVWALLEGYHSHGGLLHPYFDKFFYHGNLLEFYPANHYDHAFYEWRLSLLPHLLTFGQCAVLVLLTLIMVKGKKGIVSLCGLVYVGYMLFFKGYSTQFSVSTQLYALLASLDAPLPFIIPLEVSHIIQMASWMGFPGIAFETVRDFHQVLLSSSILLRTILFILILSRAFRSGLDLSRIGRLLGEVSSIMRLFKDWQLITSTLLAFLTASLAFLQVFGYVRGGGMHRTYEGCVELDLDGWSSIELDGLERGDQVIIRLETGTWLEAEAISASERRPVERGVRNPYNLRCSFGESLLFFRAGEGLNILKLRMRHPRIPFRVTDGLDGDLLVDVSMEGPGLALRLRDQGMDGKGSLFRMAYPLGVRVYEGFSLNLRYQVLGGEPQKVLLDIFDETDDWLYSFEAEEVTTVRGDLPEYSRLRDDELSLVALVIVLEDGGSAEILLEELSICGEEVPLYLGREEEVNYRILVERDFHPSPVYMVSLIQSFTLGGISLFRFWRRLSSFSCSKED